ncbi:unnamed protein product [Nippostrongylus brasiliensis]|uniref:Putative nudix hydrolase 7 (inferred by orthology to a C. elegans protein) n=1 Tax=Nippostrongylus brasiliensis TaxID=27835 RepID=A0A158R034_NIPBR|nr:unnamed protein product [Nippostrongylus brasiliensis]
MKRGNTAKFMPNTTVFPGGMVAPSDVELGSPTKIAALRELFEETGMLLGRKETAATSRELDALQKRTKAKPSDFKLACPSPPVENLLEWSTWLTPFSHKQRYMTSFFIALMDVLVSSTTYTTFAAELPVQMCEMEMSHYSWMAPKNCLEQANEGKIILPLPQYYELTRISQVPIDKLHEYGNISVVICPQIVKWQDHSMMSSILPGDYLYSVCHLDTNNYQQPVRSMTRADVQVDPKKPTHRAECSTQPLYSNCKLYMHNLSSKYLKSFHHFETMSKNLLC